MFRIICTGDSFTEGASVNFDDTYPKRLERYLNIHSAAPRRIYEVMNMSRAGRSTPSEERQIFKIADELQPDLIIVGYCLNDPEDHDDPKALSELREKCRYHHFRKPGGLAGSLYDRFEIARSIIHAVFKLNSQHGYRHYYHKLYKENYPGWRKSKASMIRLGELSGSRNIPIIFVIFPLLSFNLDESYPFAEAHAKVHSALEQAGLKYIDLLPAFNDINHTALEVVPRRNPHPNEFAHLIAAEAIFKDLAQSGYVKTRPKSRGGPIPFPPEREFILQK